MQIATEFWHGEAVKHVPVRLQKLTARQGRGTLMKSIRQRSERVGDLIIGVLYSQVPYASYIEYGTRRIAGGRVLRWRPGMRPEHDWPAKSGKSGEFFGRLHGAGLAVARARRAQTTMPFIRPYQQAAVGVLMRELEDGLADAMRRADAGSGED